MMITSVWTVVPSILAAVGRISGVTQMAFSAMCTCQYERAGELIFENDFPSGTDMAGEIVSGPRAGERMEFELFTRLVITGD